VVVMVRIGSLMRHQKSVSSASRDLDDESAERFNISRQKGLDGSLFCPLPCLGSILFGERPRDTSKKCLLDLVP